MARWISGALGLLFLSVAAHQTVRLVGIQSVFAWQAIGLALAFAAGAVGVGKLASSGRPRLAVVIAAGMLIAQCVSAFGVADHISDTRRAQAAAAQRALTLHEAAATRLASAIAVLGDVDRQAIASEREIKAQTSMDAAVAAIREKSGSSACKEPCRNALLSAAADARRELEIAKEENEKIKKTKVDSAQAEIAAAQAALDAAPMPPNVSQPVQSGQWPLVILNVCVNLLGGALVAVSAHGSLSRPKFASISRRRRPVGSEPEIGRVSTFVADRIERAESGRIELGDLHRIYAQWCTSSDRSPLELHEFREQLDEPLHRAGIRMRAAGNKVFLVGVTLNAT